MPDFGYTISKQRVVDLDKNEFSLAGKIRESEESFKLCIGCGTCTSTCTAGNFTPFNLRKIMLQINRGETAQIRQELGKCMLCGKCLLICPRGVNTRNVVLALSEILTMRTEAR